MIGDSSDRCQQCDIFDALLRESIDVIYRLRDLATHKGLFLNSEDSLSLREAERLVAEIRKALKQRGLE